MRVQQVDRANFTPVSCSAVDEGPRPDERPPSMTSQGLKSRHDVSNVGPSSYPEMKALPGSQQTWASGGASCPQLQPLTLE